MKTTTMIRGHLSLTPALSRWERENCFQRLGKTASDFCLMTFDFTGTDNGCSLSQRERVRVRENGTNN